MINVRGDPLEDLCAEGRINDKYYNQIIPFRVVRVDIDMIRFQLQFVTSQESCKIV